MSSAVTELEAGLQAMLQLKPPGVSGSRIQGITTLCMANVQSESLLIQKLYTHFRKAPGTHKLGVLYVVDSVTRKWTEQAKNQGQVINNDAQDGTFAAGVNRVKELLPALMNDIIHSSPDDQKDKIKKLVDIWEKGQTFPPHMLAQFKDKLNAPPELETSTTPTGSPPPYLTQSLGLAAPPQAAAPASNSSSILEALASLARQNNAPPPAISQPKDNSYIMPNAQNYSASQNPVAMNQNVPFPAPAPVNIPQPAAPVATQPQAYTAVPNYANTQPTQYAGAPPVMPAGLGQDAMQQFTLIKALADQGMSADKIAGVLAAFNQGNIGAGAPPPQFTPQNQNQNQIASNAQNGWGPRPDDSRDRNGYDRDEVRSSQDQFGFRQRSSRSRSPTRAWNGSGNAGGSPNSHRRNEQGFDYADRQRNSQGQNRDEGRGRARGGGNSNPYRQRSPNRREQSPSPPKAGGEKWIGWDYEIAPGDIKVLSRTLFVGGVTMPEYELRRTFNEFGKVQTCIVNKDKRHAFVKMVSREDAVRAKEAMEKNRAPDSQLRTRWGVGFGPRECSDYQTGVSIIPIAKLTDADRKWMLTADYGGSGGQEITSNMVVEEPDIEIGQGVSSKAISRRMATDKGGNNGPKSSRERNDEDDFGRNRRHERNNKREEREDNGPPSMPAVPSFGAAGFPFNMPGMPPMPPGFFANQNAQAQGRHS